MTSSAGPVRHGVPGAKALPRGYLRGCLLLLLAESPAHGYELLAQVSELGFPRPDAGALYRALRALEREGLVESWWTPAVAGPARRPYRPTVAGARCLEDITAAVVQSHQNLSAYLQRHRALTLTGDTLSNAS